MAVRRIVVVTCDGPCGTVQQGSSIPNDWTMLTAKPTHPVAGQKLKYETAVFCPACLDKFKKMWDKLGFSFVRVNQEEKPDVQ